MKKIKLNIEDFFNLTSSEIFNPDSLVSISHVTIDSRKVQKGSLFVAIKGEKLDGHDFVKTAVENGAAAILIENKYLDKFDDIDTTIITVDDTTNAYAELAGMWRNKLTTKIISITGSNGKTSTKDMLAEILSFKYKVHKTSANNNNHIGVPLTIFETDNSYDYLVLEHGTNHFGEIEYTAKIARPDIGLITNIGDSHLEFLKDRYGVFEEKQKLFDYTDTIGQIFLNLDDQLLKGLKKKFKNIITYSFKGISDIKGEIDGYTGEGKSIINISIENKIEKIELPLCGSASAKNFLLCAAVAIKNGFSFDELREASKSLKAVKGRLNVKMLNNFILIDDTYNSNPASMENAIDVMKKIKTFRRRVIIAGDMFELGKAAFEKHVGLYKAIQKGYVTEVYTIGEMMHYLNMKLKDTKIIAGHFAERNDLKEFLQTLPVEKSIILVKGSRGMRMEDFVEILENRGR